MDCNSAIRLGISSEESGFWGDPGLRRFRELCVNLNRKRCTSYIFETFECTSGIWNNWLLTSQPGEATNGAAVMDLLVKRVLQPDIRKKYALSKFKEVIAKRHTHHHFVTINISAAVCCSSSFSPPCQHYWATWMEMCLGLQMQINMQNLVHFSHRWLLWAICSSKYSCLLLLYVNWQ